MRFTQLRYRPFRLIPISESVTWVFSQCVFYAAFLIVIKLDFVIANVVRVGSFLRQAHLCRRIENDEIERSSNVRCAVNFKKELVHCLKMNYKHVFEGGWGPPRRGGNRCRSREFSASQQTLVCWDAVLL